MITVRPKTDSFRGRITPRDIEALDKNIRILFEDLAKVAAVVPYERVRLLPPPLVSQTDNYAPAAVTTADIIRLRAVAPVNLTGLRSGTDGQIITLVNLGSETITLKANHADSSPPNRFNCALDHALTQGQTATFYWDAAGPFWCPLGFGT